MSDELESGGEGLLSPPHTHQRTILHLDADCFYAQVEMVRQPELRDKPLGIKQKNLVVTCNYVARSQGVKKCMWLKEAMEVLPELVLVDGSDLTHYRHFSTQISGVAQSLTHRVERLSLDENFIDVTDLVDEYMNATGSSDIEGHVFGDKEPVSMDLVDPCGCGCRERLVAGSLVAKQLREQILKETGITVCAGIAHNKLLAKLVSGYHKPNQQTVVFPWQVHNVMNSLPAARSIPGIGSTTFSILKDLGISTVQELQDVPLKLLRTKFDSETCSRLKEVSNGIDETSVKKSGKAQSVGLEDAFTKVNSVAEVKVKYQILLERLLKLLKEDGRVPVSIRVSVRKFDLAKRFGHRETRQTSIPSSLFPDGVNNVGENTRSSLMKTVMGLFQKMVDTSKDFHLTLVGVAFNKLIERVREGKDISSFFGKRTREETTETLMSYYHREGRFMGERRGRGERGRGASNFYYDRRVDNHGEDVFLVGKPREYRQDPPIVQPLGVIGCFSVDEDRTFGHDRTLLKFIEPQYLTREGKTKVNIDLNRGWGKNSPYTAMGENSSLNLYQWILNNSETLVDSDDTPTRLDVDFICMRRCLIQIMKMPYNVKERWAMQAEYFRGTIYLVCYASPEDLEQRKSEPPYMKKIAMWGHKFEQIMTGGDPDEGVCANEEFRCVLKVKVDNFSCLLAPEVDCADPELFEEDFKDLSSFITVKCNREVDTADAFKVECFRKFMLNKWWAQNKLSGIPRVVVGFRTEEGQIYRLENYDTDELPTLAKGLWEPRVSLNILTSFLAFVKKMIMEAPEAVHRFERQSPIVIRHSIVPSVRGAAEGPIKVLPDWYREQLFSPLDQE
ncbi:hypothetical protein Pcinc_015324 [Petrolisthes cinctipes]|uniref:UmuC domain-containing protein n=1 Tax=Petrolisthes cinctipes TaxID=88211 RepID=A0AAE1FT80_PETCI|nr:hypothetical protein Pcinc_015324 [Petrolisthes cinctipes]